MYRYAVVLSVFFVFVSTQTLADAASDMHKQSAFMFAKRKEWNEAISHAKLANSDILVKYFTWEYLKDPQSDASFDDITKFMDANPDWPDMNALEKRAEVALMANNPSDATLNEWFSKHAPQTYLVKLKMAKNQEALRMMIREAWVADNYDKDTEMKILVKYRLVLRPIDHVHRADRLVWEGDYDGAKRLLNFMPKEERLLFQARLALAEDKFYAPATLLRVPGALKNDPGLMYERIRWRIRADDKDGVRELLLTAPAEVPYPEKWWGIRDRQIREALGEGNVDLAEKLLTLHAQKAGTVSYKEVLWLKAWIELEFRNHPQEAYEMFTNVFEQSETPAGKARSAYWVARAAQAMKKNDSVRWFGIAARYTTTFYGELAAWELNRHGYTIVSDPLPTEAEKNAFKNHELVQLAYELAAADERDAAGRFIMYLVQNAKSDKDMILSADLGRDIGRIDFSVRAAKKVLQNNIVSLENGWPVITPPADVQIEQALMLALMRQESEFNTDAVSTSGACGLLQLLPATAKETARKNDMLYSYDKLFDPRFNMTLGSIYMNKLVARFDGSYVLAIASYNAGPNRVSQWTETFGRPGSDIHQAVDWIEKIPTSETRNYVEHVVENMEVYRFLLAGKRADAIVIANDLTRAK